MTVILVIDGFLSEAGDLGGVGARTAGSSVLAALVAQNDSRYRAELNMTVGVVVRAVLGVVCIRGLSS